jgi:integrase
MRVKKLGSDLIFATEMGKPLLKDALRRLVLKPLGFHDEKGNPICAHGFRSTFRDWAGSVGIPREQAEQCLAHAVGNATEQAYARDRHVELRRVIMGRWGQRCGSPDKVAEVVRLKTAKG